MKKQFTRVSCWIYNHPVPPIPFDKIIYYESSWDYKTNMFIKGNLDKINEALMSYPNEYCWFQLLYVPQPVCHSEESDMAFQKELLYNEAFSRNAPSPFEGIISCALMQDKNHIDPSTQRILTINLEGCDHQSIIAAIRYMAQLADQLKDQVSQGTGFIPNPYRRMWQVNLPKECKYLYDTSQQWLDCDFELNFSQTILMYNESAHRLYFVTNTGAFDECFIGSDLFAQAYYIFIWNHPEGVSDAELTRKPKNDQEKAQNLSWEKEIEYYYRIISPGVQRKTFDYGKTVREFVTSKRKRDEVRSKIKSSIIRHETSRVNPVYARKVYDIFGIQGGTGKISVKNRTKTIILPDELKKNLLENKY